MPELTVPKLAKWPFVLGDALLLGVAYFIYSQGHRPMELGELLLATGCVAGGALFSIAPFILEYRALVKVAEAGALTTVVSQIQRLEEIAAQISGATGLWQAVQEQAGRTATGAREISERMTAELKDFTQFMQHANDTEKSNLRLEVEKLRRAETEWLQVLIRMLDHTYALNQGALRSGQRNLIQQLGNFQNACRDAARRIGLAPFVAQPSEPFDAKRHEAMDGDGKPPTDGIVEETLATGYTFQGRLLRPALVRLRGEGPVEPPASGSGEGQAPASNPG